MSKAKPSISIQQILDTPAGKLNANLIPDAGKVIPKKSKYKNVRIETEDGVFDSKKELREWKKLRLRQQAGEIYGLSRQTEFLLPGGVIYRADFTYFERPNNDYSYSVVNYNYIVADAKGVRTDVYRIKKKQLKDRYNFDIVEV